MTNTVVPTRVSNSTPSIVEFKDPSTGVWGPEVEVTFSDVGTITFVLLQDPISSAYIFFGATQKIIEGTTTSPDTEWRLTISELGRAITFATNDNEDQTIGVKLGLIPKNTDDLLNVIISADPRLKNIKV
ncbi:MAG: hypothetical protein ABJH06_11095 [Paraglaciecola sp.]|uniref:hypothetical protein n=1 Tax=Paraglaciecola sp. TaxID=1920173 RepID=UPI00326585C8